MYQMLYFSAARELLPDAELDSILSASQRNTARDGLTGMLLYAEGSFFQVLEGAEDAVRQTYTRIKSDARHSRIINVLQSPIERRDFADWSMGFRRERNVDALPPAFFQLSHEELDHVTARECSDIVIAMLKSFAQVNLNP